VKRMVVRLLCRHDWREHTVLGVGDHEFSDLRSCTKCTASKLLFSGTRKQWRQHHGYDTHNIAISS